MVTTMNDDRRRLLLLGGAVAVVVILGLLFIDGSGERPPIPRDVSVGGEGAEAPTPPALPDDQRDSPAVGTASAKEDDTPSPSHEFTVRVVGPDGGPLSHAVLDMLGVGWFSADPDGWVRIPLLRPMDSLPLGVVYPPYPYEAATRPAVRNGGDLELPDARPLEILPVSAETGEFLPGCRARVWREIHGPVELEIVGPSAGRLEPGPVLAGSSGMFRLSIDAPDGYTVGHPAKLAFSATGSRLADEYRLKVPVWPELELLVQVREQSGMPVEGARVSGAIVAGRVTAIRPALSDREGVIRVEGLPAIPGETVRITAEKEGRTASGHVVVAGFRMPANLEVTLPPRGFVRASSSASIGIGGGAGGSFGDRGDIRGPAPTAALEVLVLRRDGRPVSGAQVVLLEHERSARTDGNGVARFEGLRPIEEWVSVREPGYVSGPAVKATLRNAVEVGVTVREGVGRSSFVLVLNKDRLPVCCAVLTVRTENKVPYTPVVNGVQDLAILTGRDGRAVLPELPAGKVTVTARYGTRSAKGEVEAGGSLTLILTR